MSKKIMTLDSFMGKTPKKVKLKKKERREQHIKIVPKKKPPVSLSEFVLKKELERYFSEIEKNAKEIYKIAEKARQRGVDPKPYPEVSLAEDLAARVEGLLGFKGISTLIREKYGKISNEALSLQLVRTYIQMNRTKLGEEKAAENAIRIGLAFLTGGITTAALEGISRVRIKQNPDGSKYLAIYFASPIRSAGGTEQALTVVMADFARRELGLDVFKPTEAEVERYVEEIHLYERFVAHLQYPSSPKEVRFVASHVPVEITGDPTSNHEVSGYRDLPRVETNAVRGGALLVLNDGILGKAPKIYGIIKKAGLDGWEWLEELVKMREKPSAGEMSDEEPKYLKEVITGRPLFGEPAAKGGFRVRYGRAPNTGLAGAGINPATMYILGEFIAPGTQLKLEGPGKACVAMPVNRIRGPFVRLTNGDAMFIDDIETARSVVGKVEKILFLGDILIAVGEFIENKHTLYPPGYSEEWWAEEYRLAAGREIDPWEIKDGVEALDISRKYGIPLHPRYTYAWHDITIQEFLQLREWVLRGDRSDTEVKGKYDPIVKDILERLYVPHVIRENKIVIKDAAPFLKCMLLEYPRIVPETNDVLQLINNRAGVKVRAFAPRYIGARMGRPEKMSIRKMKPPVHVLYPVGEAGGQKRDLLTAIKNKNTAKVELNARKCRVCGKITWKRVCCGKLTDQINICPECGSQGPGTTCPRDNRARLPYKKMQIDIDEIRELKRKYPSAVLVKGVKGLTNKTRTPEVIEKGFLRAVHNVYVFRDGTIRFDATDAPLTHFRPKDIGTSVETLRKLGYTHDIHGNPLEREDQVLEIFPQDIIVPFECARYLVRVAQFVDDELKEIYNMSPFYNICSIKDTIGLLVLGLAPHTSAGIVGRIIGFTNSNNIYAHPLWHAAKRRNCDGDEDAVLLLLDAFLNFSKEYLPDSPGSKMDAPLVVIFQLNPKEVDDEVYNMDIMWKYPLEIYQKGLESADYTEIKDTLKTIESRLDCPRGIGYSIPLDLPHDIGPHRTMYSTLETMQAKLKAQLSLARKIRAVSTDIIVLKILRTHLIKDIRGNMRSFGTQKFRCIKCNYSLPVPPLTGKCPQCGGKMVLTVHPSSVTKYLATIDMLSNVSSNEYIKNEARKIRFQIKQMFRVTQSLLDDWTK